MATPPRRLVLAGCAALALVVGVAAAEAVPVRGPGALSGPAFHAEPGDTARVLVTNPGRQPVRVEILFLDAADYSVLATSGPLAVAPRTTAGADHVYAGAEESVVAVRYRARGRTVLRVSLEVVAPGGETRVFTDGFESGDVTR